MANPKLEKTTMQNHEIQIKTQSKHKIQLLGKRVVPLTVLTRSDTHTH